MARPALDENGLLYRVARSPAAIRVHCAIAGLIFPPASRAGWEWRDRPPDVSGRKLCVFVTCSPDGGISEQARLHARRWHDEGYVVILVVQVARLDQSRPAADFAHVIVRENRGYDFGAWSTALRHTAFLETAEIVATVNDSIYGPGQGFEDMLARAERSAADIVGVVESPQHGRHFQSFLTFWKGPALRSRAFRDFWRSIRLGGRRQVIDCYELSIPRRFEAAGLTADTLFPLPANGSNPTLRQWRELIEAGFPYVKRQLLRDNPFGADLGDWPQYLADRGFDVGSICRDLGIEPAPVTPAAPTDP